MVNIFQGGPQVNEKFNESFEQSKVPLKDLKGKDIKLNGGGLYKPFNPKNLKKIPKEPKEEIPDDPFAEFHKDVKNKVYDPNHIMPANEIPQFKDTGIENIEEEQKKYKERLSHKSKNLKNLISDISTIQNKLPDFDFTIKENKFESEILNKIGGNYLKNPDQNGNFNIEKDFSQAIIETKDQILEECINLKRDSETYKIAIKNINSGEIKKQLEGIETLYILAYSNEGKLAKSTLDKYKKKKQEKLKQEAKKIEKELKNLPKNQKKLEILQKRKQEIIKEMSELTGIKNGKKLENGDIFKAGKIDKVQEQIEKKQD